MRFTQKNVYDVQIVNKTDYYIVPNTKSGFLAGTNVAYLRPTWSYPINAGDNSYKAVDGITSADYRDMGCSNTYISAGYHLPWLVVELDNIYSVYSVVLTNRGDCCGKYNLYIFLQHNYRV